MPEIAPGGAARVMSLDSTSSGAWTQQVEKENRQQSYRQLQSTRGGRSHTPLADGSFWMQNTRHGASAASRTNALAATTLGYLTPPQTPIAALGLQRSTSIPNLHSSSPAAAAHSSTPGYSSNPGRSMEHGAWSAAVAGLEQLTQNDSTDVLTDPSTDGGGSEAEHPMAIIRASLGSRGGYSRSGRTEAQQKRPGMVGGSTSGGHRLSTTESTAGRPTPRAGSRPSDSTDRAHKDLCSPAARARSTRCTQRTATGLLITDPLSVASRFAIVLYWVASIVVFDPSAGCLHSRSPSARSLARHGTTC